ncbi:hypothetical protein L596_011967 [Steinernema carpocapsae]|uniref:Uncharacterized protein n=1 Tax=Steinernema carpocapsae TaxID=34508 RepID=A0A4U5NWI8_STECR|nr:hypothetical protein L596_011967 [Steinernema carpocapsae]
MRGLSRCLLLRLPGRKKSDLFAHFGAPLWTTTHKTVLYVPIRTTKRHIKMGLDSVSHKSKKRVLARYDVCLVGVGDVLVIIIFLRQRIPINERVTRHFTPLRSFTNRFSDPRTHRHLLTCSICCRASINHSSVTRARRPRAPLTQTDNSCDFVWHPDSAAKSRGRKHKASLKGIDFVFTST